MNAPWEVYCETASLAVEVARIGAAVGVPVRPTISAEAVIAPLEARSGTTRTAVLLAEPPEDAELVRLALSHPSGAFVVGLVCEAERARGSLQLAGDLGLVAVSEVRPLVSAFALLSTGSEQPWKLSSRALTDLDRHRLGPIPSGRVGRLVPADDGYLAVELRGEGPCIVGEPSAVGEAMRALRQRSLATPPARAVMEGVRVDLVEEVLFGPPRALSDPASKAALEPYGIPLPVEELCTSPSRAAAEATRIGFPVRLSLASPDLRTWEHPGWTVGPVESASRVRDSYRKMMASAAARAPTARLLGVSVSAHAAPRALLTVRLRPLPEHYVRCDIAFADPHGQAAGDRTTTVLPADPASLGRALDRLQGRTLLFGPDATAEPAADASSTLDRLGDLFLRLAAFVDEQRRVVEQVDLHPLALLPDGTVEVRDARVTVGDAYQRSLD